MAQCTEGYACLGPGVQLSAFNNHTCALADDGRVWCWGENTYGQLGDGTTQSSGFPVLAKLNGPAIDVSAGYSHTCALLESGTPYCWGFNDFGGTAPDVSTTAVTEPMEIAVPGVRFTKIASGDHHTCAITDRSTVYCWGETTRGQCGVDGTAIGASHTGPVEIGGLTKVRSIAAGLAFTCAVRAGSPSLMCWGSNANNSTLGPAATGLTYSAAPVVVDFGVLVLGVAAGYESTYAIAADGQTYSWGANDRQQLGAQEPAPFLATPVPVVIYDENLMRVGPAQDVVALPHAGASSECAKIWDLSQRARYVCWGSDNHGELGFGVAKQVSPYGRGATVLPQSADNMARGNSAACITAHENAATEIWCYGLAGLVANGTNSGPDQESPQPIKWNPENFEKVLLQ